MKQMIETRRAKNIRLIVYKIAQIIQMINEILKKKIEMIVWAFISFLIDECKDFLIEMMNHYKNFLIKKIDVCKNFAIFQEFSEFSVEMKMKMIVSRNFSLLMTREVIVLLIVDETILLMIAAFLK